MQKERKKVTLKRDKSILKEVTDYAVGQLEGNEWKYEEKYPCTSAIVLLQTLLYLQYFPG